MQLLAPYAAVRYHDRYTERWIQFRSPESWRGHLRVHYRRVPFVNLLPAGSHTHLEVKSYWRNRLARGEAIPPLVASATPAGAYYLHDGNHRYYALADYFGEYAWLAQVRVALLEPLPNYRFVWRWFGEFGTYLLEPVGTPADAGLRPVPAQRRFLMPPPFSATAAEPSQGGGQRNGSRLLFSAAPAT
jgi:hypothetical protein